VLLLQRHESLLTADARFPLLLINNKTAIWPLSVVNYVRGPNRPTWWATLSGWVACSISASYSRQRSLLLPARQRARVLAATGSLNATIRMTSFTQVFTTADGRTLAVKIELFPLMAAISAYHALWLRPRLVQALDHTSEPAVEAAVVGVSTVSHSGHVMGPAGSLEDARPASDEKGRTDHRDDAVETLSHRLGDWLRREAVLGVAVLLCVALLGAYAGTLAPPPTSAAASSSGPYVSTQQAGPYGVTLQVAPASFGVNSFIVTLKDAQGQPVTGAAVLVLTSHRDMDMGTQSVQLQPTGADAPGSYAGQGDLVMAGRWSAVVKILPPGQKDVVSTMFAFSVG